MYNRLQSHIRSLENLGIKGDTYGLILQLPSHFRVEWAQTSAGKESDLDNLRDFLKSELQRRERSQTFTTLSEEHSILLLNLHDGRLTVWLLPVNMEVPLHW